MSWTNILYSQYLRTIYFLTNWDKFPSSTQLPSCGIFYKLECKHLLRLSTILQFSAMSELWLYGYVISFVVLFHVNMKMQINHWCFIGITHRNWPDWTNELEFEIQKLQKVSCLLKLEKQGEGVICTNNTCKYLYNLI